MANAMYALGKEKFCNGEIDWEDDTFRVYAVDGDDYSPNTTTDEYMDDIAGAGLIAYVALASTTNSLGVCDAADSTLSSVSGDEFEYLVICKWVSDTSDSPLILLIDTATGLPMTPSGSDIVITWDSGANKIFAM